MTRKKINNFQVYKEYFYILEFTNLMDVTVLHYYFLNRAAAQRCIDSILGRKGKYFRVVRGDKVPLYLNLQVQHRTHIGKATKYEYNYTLLTSQDKKSFRTMQRRRLRRMGLLTTVHSKKHYTKAPGIVKYVPNKQVVAMNKNSAAKVFRLERKPSRYYYILLKKEEPRKRGYLFWVKVIRFNAESGKMKGQEFHLRKNDIIIPYLIWDIERLVYEKAKESTSLMAYYRRNGFRFYEEGEK